MAQRDGPIVTARRYITPLAIIACCTAIFAVWALAFITAPHIRPPQPSGSYLGSVPVRGGVPFALHDGGVNAVCIVDRSASVMPPLFKLNK